MKKKFLTLISLVLLCFALTSCNLKDAITGSNNAATDENTNDTNSNDNKENENNLNNEENKDTTTSTTDNSTSNTENKESDLSNEDSSSQDDSKNDTTSSDATSTVNRNCRIFYFNTTDLNTYYVDTTVPVIDNAFVTALTTKLHESPDNSNNFLIIPNDFGVKSATIDEETGILKVVFNEDFTYAMHLGTASESGLISAIISTYGYNYGIDKVALYFKDELYTGLKGELPEGYYTVDTSSAIKLN